MAEIDEFKRDGRTVVRVKLDEAETLRVRRMGSGDSDLWEPGSGDDHDTRYLQGNGADLAAARWLGRYPAASASCGVSKNSTFSRRGNRAEPLGRQYTPVVRTA